MSSTGRTRWQSPSAVGTILWLWLSMDGLLLARLTVGRGSGSFSKRRYDDCLKRLAIGLIVIVGIGLDWMGRNVLCVVGFLMVVLFVL